MLERRCFHPTAIEAEAYGGDAVLRALRGDHLRSRPGRGAPASGTPPNDTQRLPSGEASFGLSGQTGTSPNGPRSGSLVEISNDLTVTVHLFVGYASGLCCFSKDFQTAKVEYWFPWFSFSVECFGAGSRVRTTVAENCSSLWSI